MSLNELIPGINRRGASTYCSTNDRYPPPAAQSSNRYIVDLFIINIFHRARNETTPKMTMKPVQYTKPASSCRPIAADEVVAAAAVCEFALVA